MKKLTTLIVLALATVSLSFAQSWSPYELTGPAYFAFEVSEPNRPDVSYSIDIRASDVTDEYGEALYAVTSTRTSFLSLDSALLGDGISGLVSGFTSMYLMMLIPTMADMDMEPGERMSMMGMGRVTVIGQAQYGGRTGHHLKLENKNSDDEYETVMEWVIDYDLPMPIMTRTYDGGELQREERLVEYRAN